MAISSLNEPQVSRQVSDAGFVAAVGIICITLPPMPRYGTVAVANAAPLITANLLAEQSYVTVTRTVFCFCCYLGSLRMSGHIFLMKQ